MYFCKSCGSTSVDVKEEIGLLQMKCNECYYEISTITDIHKFVQIMSIIKAIAGDEQAIDFAETLSVDGEDYRIKYAEYRVSQITKRTRPPRNKLDSKNINKLQPGGTIEEIIGWCIEAEEKNDLNEGD